MLDKCSLNISNRSSKYGNGDSIKIYLSLSLSLPLSSTSKRGFLRSEKKDERVSLDPI